MLTIKRVPTVVSNYQEESYSQETDGGGGCGWNSLGDCCLPVARLPVYAFKKESQENPAQERDRISSSESVSLHDLLLSQWDNRMSKGLFRYDVTSCETKIIPGQCGFIAQLNEGRHLKKRPTEFRVDKVLQRFDETKFNFTKVGQEEALFRFEESSDDESRFFPSAPVESDGKKSPHIVAINVSPIEYGHVLLIPRVLDRFPQCLDHESVYLALQFAKEASDPSFRVGYNSLGAFATINHLHFQAYHLQLRFAVEKAPTRRVITTGEIQRGVVVSSLLHYPVRGFVFEGGNSTRDLSDAVAGSCIWLQNNNVPFNVLISDCGRRVFLFPQCYATKQARGEVRQELLETQVNPAVWEIGGHMVLKRREDYANASEASAWRLLAEVSLSEERFDELKPRVVAAAGLKEGVRVEEENERKGSSEPCRQPSCQDEDEASASVYT